MVRLRWSSAWMAWVAGAKERVGSEAWWSSVPLAAPFVEGDMLVCRFRGLMVILVLNVVVEKYL